MAFFVPQVHLGFMPLAVNHRRAERTAGFAQAHASLGSVHQQVVRTVPSDHLGSGVSGQEFCGVIPVGDLALAVDKIDRVVKIVDQALVKLIGILWGRCRLPQGRATMAAI
jgi:hypothetical protein